MAETHVSRYTPAPRGVDPFANFFGANPFADIDRLFTLFDDSPAVRRAGLSPRTAAGASVAGMIAPRIDVHEGETDILLSAELPGLDEKDVELTVEDGILTLSGEKKYEKRSEKDSAHLIERSYGSFRRSFSLPETVEADKIAAKFDKGVLTITLPKRAIPEKQARKISIG